MFLKDWTWFFILPTGSTSPFSPFATNHYFSPSVSKEVEIMGLFQCMSDEYSSIIKLPGNGAYQKKSCFRIVITVPVRGAQVLFTVGPTLTLSARSLDCFNLVWEQSTCCHLLVDVEIVPKRGAEEGGGKPSATCWLQHNRPFRFLVKPRTWAFALYLFVCLFVLMYLFL